MTQPTSTITADSSPDRSIAPSTSVRTTGVRWFVRKGSLATRLVFGLLRARLLGLVPGLFFNRVGGGTRFWGFPRFQNLGGHITIGRRCMFGTRVFFLAGPEAVIEIGDQASVNDYGFLTALKSIVIEEQVAIGEFVSIRDYDHEFDGQRSIRETGFVAAPVRIKKGAWIGRGVMITKGVTIGEGAVIGANSVVTRDIPDYTVAVGAPAKVIRHLRPDESASATANP